MVRIRYGNLFSFLNDSAEMSQTFHTIISQYILRENYQRYVEQRRNQFHNLFKRLPFQNSYKVEHILHTAYLRFHLLIVAFVSIFKDYFWGNNYRKTD